MRPVQDVEHLRRSGAKNPERSAEKLVDQEFETFEDLLNFSSSRLYDMLMKECSLKAKSADLVVEYCALFGATSPAAAATSNESCEMESAGKRKRRGPSRFGAVEIQCPREAASSTQPAERDAGIEVETSDVTTGLVSTNHAPPRKRRAREADAPHAGGVVIPSGSTEVPPFIFFDGQVAETAGGAPEETHSMGRLIFLAVNGGYVPALRDITKPNVLWVNDSSFDMAAASFGVAARGNRDLGFVRKYRMKFIVRDVGDDLQQEWADTVARKLPPTSSDPLERRRVIHLAGVM